MIKKFTNTTEYNAFTKPTSESMVSQAGTECKYDGINVVTLEPEDGDALYLDEQGNKVWLKGGDELNTALLPSTWTPVAVAIERRGRKVLAMNVGDTAEQYVGLWQFAITAITSTTPTIKLRLTSASSYGNYTEVPLSLASTDINLANAAAISQQIQAKATEVGSAQSWWAYLADANYNITTDENEAVCIIVQCDTDNHYNQNAVAGTGMTVAGVTYRDSTANATNGVRKDGGNTGVYLNVTRGAIYASTNGADDVTLGLSGDTMSLNAFNNSTNAEVKAYKQARGTYETYIRDYKTLADWQPRSGVFSLPRGAEMTTKYGPLTAPTLAGGTKAIFPALNAAWRVGYNADGLRQGSWHLVDVHEALAIMSDSDWSSGLGATDVKRKYNLTLRKMNGTAVTNNALRWFAQRYVASRSWVFSGGNGYLNGRDVANSNRARAVVLLDI